MQVSHYAFCIQLQYIQYWLSPWFCGRLFFGAWKFPCPNYNWCTFPTAKDILTKEKHLCMFCMWLRFVNGEPSAWNQVNIVGPHWIRYHPSFKVPGSWKANVYIGGAQLIGDCLLFSCVVLFNLFTCKSGLYQCSIPSHCSRDARRAS
jgi:hypothetical protein